MYMLYLYRYTRDWAKGMQRDKKSVSCLEKAFGTQWDRCDRCDGMIAERHRLFERFLGALGIWLIAVFLFCALDAFFASSDQYDPVKSRHTSPMRLCHSDYVCRDLRRVPGHST